ncbi:protein TOC75, chloroplastic [Cryptomeria japonica]|uniref:protein TOC75, chloroplastic n=1 Tax=Cryptomeria japonica TaxID=3369 RepID=UPI0027DA130D|nr:protein TOC75, chloroplastic [Cryptomeria japonica]XP_057815740.2 protein TOC75, chloroplastic [Cryptomeria japonica]
MSSGTMKHSLQLSSTGLAPAIPFNQQRVRRTVPAINTIRASSAPSHNSDALGCCNNGFGLNKSESKTFVYIGGTVGVGLATGIVLQLAGPSGGGTGGGWMGGWGGGDGGGNFWAKIGAAIADDKRNDDSEDFDKHGMSVGLGIPINRLFSHKRYKISNVEIYDEREFKTINKNSEDCFYEMFSIQPGGVYKKEDLQKEHNNLKNSGMFATLEMETITQPDGTLKLKINFTESSWRGADRLRVVNVGFLKGNVREFDPNWDEEEKKKYFKEVKQDYKRRVKRTKHVLLPPSVERRISRMLSKNYRLSARLLQEVRDEVQRWYHENGYACAQVVNFGHLNTKEIICEVIEGDITKVDIQFQDKMGNLCEGNTSTAVIIRELPDELWTGRVFNIDAGRQALRNINGLALFSNIEINPKPDETNEGGIAVEVKLKELEHKTAEVSTEWSIVPGSGGRPHLASIQPGGSVTFEHRNLKGLNRSILGTVTSNNLFNPQDDLGFKMEYVHPYIDGLTNYDRNRTFRANCFNSRKLSPVFTGGPGLEEVPAIWVDRAGLKANISENLSRQSKFTYGVVIEEITTRDETSTICTSGARALPSGALTMDGPPTTLSGTGIDRMAFLQANITRDNTIFVNGTPVGARDVFQLDQGLGIGSKFPFFNRHQMSMTRFIQLKKAQDEGGPPPVMVLHGRYGGCVGDLPSYDAFTLGGPYSVRGYNMGELGACRNILELAAELRLPVRKTHAYAFAEYGTDLGSSKDVKGNPTEFFRRAGHGASYGAGVKLGLVRAEYAVDHNAGTGSVLVRFGERF